MSIIVRPVASTEESEAVARLFARVWGTTDEATPLPADVVHAVSAWGGCVLAAFARDEHDEHDGHGDHEDHDQRDELVGATVGIAAAPHSDTLASLIAGVAPHAAGRGVGAALKEAQRRWAAERDVAGIEWTFDPLVRRNAHFNLNRLGAEVVAYHVEHYPPIPDGINDGDLTDRLLVRLDVRDAAPRPPVEPAGAVVVLREGPDGRPLSAERPADAPWLVGTPQDIEGLRRADTEAALAWRLALRAAFQAEPERRVEGFTRDGSYLLTKKGLT